VIPAKPGTETAENMKKNKAKVLAVTGASGGHIFPAMAFLEALEEKYNGIETCVLLPEKSVISAKEKPGCTIKYIQMPSVKMSIDFKNINSIVRLIKGSLESVGVLLKFQPDIVIGFGGLSSIPVVMCAWLLRMKTLIHEQNVVPGRANKLLSMCVDKIAVSFEETKNYLDNYRSRVVVTGNPLRQSLIKMDKIDALNYFGLSADKFTVLVMGGSRGSHRINMEFVEAVSLMPNASVFQVIHLCGQADFEPLKRRYAGLHVKCALFSFFDAMQYAYSASDLAVCRAGATTIAELIFFGVPAIFIPYPYAYKHQYKNAKVMEEKGRGIIIEEERLGAGVLRGAMESYVNAAASPAHKSSAFPEFPNAHAGDLLVEAAMSCNQHRL
jgi:UDP-N-acetylglucosamine--N-acetylmuramyl-(pentapeptide) pyrophosphoryl-undecaprenol N-acetylglucosamine transferase